MKTDKKNAKQKTKEAYTITTNYNARFKIVMKWKLNESVLQIRGIWVWLRFLVRDFI